MTTPTYQGKFAQATVARLQFDPIHPNSWKYVKYMNAFYDQLKKDGIKFQGISYVLDDDDQCVGLYAWKHDVVLTKIY